MRLGLPIAIAIAMACTDFDSPSELGDVQILAVRATPKAIPAGGRAKLEFVVAGPEGILEPGPAQWVITDGLGTEIVGSIETEGDDVYYVAPDDLTEPAGVTLTLFTEAAGVQLNAVKAIGIGLPETPNPRFVRLSVGSVTTTRSGSTIPIPNGDFQAKAVLSTDADPTAVQIAWYSTFGEADPIRGESVTIELDEERSTTEGPLVVVGRDGFGGTDWLSVTLVRE